MDLALPVYTYKFVRLYFSLAAIASLLRLGLQQQQCHLLYLTQEHVSNLQTTSNFGNNSCGFVQINPLGQLQQDCVNDQDPQTCSAIVGGILSGLYIASQGVINQAAESQLICGNYSRFVIDNGCSLILDQGAQIRPDVDYGGGRMELYCGNSNNALTWSMGEGTYLSMAHQTFINVTADFTVGFSVLIDMQPGSSLIINDVLEIQHTVFLTLQKNSRFQINPTQGTVARITSSVAGTTTVLLNEAATIMVSGAFSVGSGTAVTMTVETSGYLLITKTGQFSVAATQFTVGPSSFWVVSGSFQLDDSSTFDSGMQSNLTVSGSIQTQSGDLILAGFSSVVIGGACINQGYLATNRFSRFVTTSNSNIQLYQSNVTLSEWATATFNGAVTMKSGANFLVGAGADAIQSIQLTMQNGQVILNEGSSSNFNTEMDLEGGSQIIVGVGANVAVTGQRYTMTGGSVNVGEGASFSASGTWQMGGGKVQLGEGATMVQMNSFSMTSGSIQIGQGASLIISGVFQMQGANAGSITLGQGAVLNILAEFTMQGGGILIGQGATFVIAQQFQMQGGLISLDRGASAYFNGSLATTASFAISLGVQAAMAIMPNAQLSPYANATIVVSDNSDFILQGGIHVTVAQSTAITISPRSICTFSNKLSVCIINVNLAVPSFTNQTITQNNSHGMFCF